MMSVFSPPLIKLMSDAGLCETTNNISPLLTELRLVKYSLNSISAVLCFS